MEEVSISEGELLIQDSPIAKLLIQMRSPRDDNAKVSVTTGAEKDRSEGEISRGEDIVNNDRPDVIMREQRSINNFSLGKYLYQWIGSINKSESDVIKKNICGSLEVFENFFYIITEPANKTEKITNTSHEDCVILNVASSI